MQLFRSILEQPELDTYLLYIYGPGGQGKTTLTKAFLDICGQQDIACLRLDGRDMNPTPNDFMAQLNYMLGATDTDVFTALQQKGDRFVLLLDTYELLTPIDNWLRQEFLPQLPDTVLTVTSGRKAPSKEWVVDAAWQTLMKAIPLRNFSPTESNDYLVKRAVAPDDVTRILDFTHGHPLALSVAADLCNQYPGKPFNPDESPDMVRTLLENFVQKVPGPAHRSTLEICALVHITTESLLQQVLEVEDASELFAWLHELSFVDAAAGGIFPHDLAREAICADLRWRNPDWNTLLHNRIRQYYMSRLEGSSGLEQRRILFCLNYLHRQHPMVKPYFDWQESGGFWADKALATDHQYLHQMVLQHEGAVAAAAFDFWAHHEAGQIWVFRNADKQSCGFVLLVQLHLLDKSTSIADSVVQQVFTHVQQHFGLRKGDVCTLFRFWMAGDSYQAVSAMQSSIFLAIVQYYISTPGLAITMLSCTLPQFWQAVLNYADLEHVPALDFAVTNEALGGTVPAGWYMHDWRKTPPAHWLNLLGQREVGEQPAAAADSPKIQVLVLSEDEFSTSVYEALKEYRFDKKLLHNPLLKSRFVLTAAQNNSDAAVLLAALKECLADATDSIKESPREEKLHRVLVRTFFNPVGSQEQVADYLNIPFSTYRRYLRKGVNIVTDYLWALETGG